jgi:outer membrane protein assembly factor BamB
MVCKRGLGNCGRNYEGLAIAPKVTTPCSGFACSKSDGALYCLTERDGRFTADPAGAITFDKPDALADCAFAGNGTLWAGDNLLGMSEVYRIDGWAQPTTAKVVPIDILGVGFPEVIAVRSDVIYRMSDTGGEPSLMAKFRCQGIVP